LQLPSDRQYLNHLGTVHAGAQLAFAEASSGEFCTGILVRLTVFCRSCAAWKRNPATPHVAASYRLQTPLLNLSRDLTLSSHRKDVLSFRERIATGLREGGRVILDLWTPEFFIADSSERELKGPGGIVRETKRLQGDRLFVHLDYPHGSEESFEWQLSSSDQIDSMAESGVLSQLLGCTDF
jgi:hypothetical protein